MGKSQAGMGGSVFASPEAGSESGWRRPTLLPHLDSQAAPPLCRCLGARHREDGTLIPRGRGGPVSTLWGRK